MANGLTDSEQLSELGYSTLSEMRKVEWVRLSEIRWQLRKALRTHDVVKRIEKGHLKFI